MQLHPPLGFSKEPIRVAHYVRVSDGVLPRELTNEDDGPLQTHPVAVLASQFDFCYVRDIVRLEYRNFRWTLLEGGLENPEVEPWFLMRGLGKKVDFYFLVNRHFHLYPLTVLPDKGPGVPLSEPALDRYCLTSPKFLGEAWSDFSELDRQMVEASIQAYLHAVGLCK